MGKLKTIDIKGLCDISAIMDKCHTVFKETMANKNDKVKLGDSEILVPLNWIEHKAELFWHAASIEEKARIDILPCTNDITSSICANNCVAALDFILLNNGEEREKCIYRATRVNWIREIIDLYNNNDARVKYWKKLHSNKKNRIYLRYQEEELDYIVIFEEKKENRVILITGYPIFFISAKKDYENDYQRYCKVVKQK